MAKKGGTKAGYAAKTKAKARKARKAVRSQKQKTRAKSPKKKKAWQTARTTRLPLVIQGGVTAPSNMMGHPDAIRDVPTKYLPDEIPDDVA